MSVMKSDLMVACASVVRPVADVIFLQMPASREDSVYLAKLAEQAERYEGESRTITYYPDSCG